MGGGENRHSPAVSHQDGWRHCAASCLRLSRHKYTEKHGVWLRGTPHGRAKYDRSKAPAVVLVAICLALLSALATGTALGAFGFPVPDPERRIGHLDGLRGYLALAVMMHHFDLWMNREKFGGWGHSSSQMLASLGPAGVSMFFMTTGLVFYPRILAGVTRIKWRQLYITRIFRILPLQITTVVIIAAISWYMAPVDGHGSIPGNLKAAIYWITSYGEPPLVGFPESHLVNCAVLWSLWYEWVFYFLILPIAACARHCTRRFLPAAAVPVGLLVIGLVSRCFPQSLPSLYFLPLFAFGMVAFELAQISAVRRFLAHPVAALIAVAMFLVALSGNSDAFSVYKMTIYAFMFTCIASGNSIFGVLHWRGSVVLGEISFGVYLIHGIVLWVLFSVLLASSSEQTLVYASIVIAAPIAVLMSALAHLVIERPGIAFGRSFSGRRQSPQGDGVGLSPAEIAP